ncbi:MAG: hypothetical protein ACYC4T_05545 [Melioribacteraceae bacterium]
MLNKRKFHRNYVFSILILVLSIVFAACSNDNNPVDSNPSGTSKVSGRVTTSDGLSKTLGKNGGAASTQGGGVQGAVVILAQVQADGSLSTVSTQSVTTDVDGKFTVETKLSGVKNLVVVATQSSTTWKAVVSSTVQTGTTVYAPPVNTEATTEAEIFIRLKAAGKTNVVSQSDVQLYVNADVAAQIKGNANAEDQFITCLENEATARTQASSNSYFGITSSQTQAIVDARAQAQASFEAALYAAGESQSASETEWNNYQRAIISAYTNAGVKVEAYAKLMGGISSKAFVNSAASMSSNAYMAASKSYYLRLALVLKTATEVKFQEAGASSSQMSTVASAGTSLSASIKNSITFNQMMDAFAQYHSSVVAQLKLTFSAYANAIDTIEAGMNGMGGMKAILNTAVGASVSTDVIVNAYVNFFNSCKTAAQTAMTGASSAQVNSVSEILILVNMN